MDYRNFSWQLKSTLRPLLERCVLENHKKWVVETGLIIKVVSQQDFRQDFLSIELGPRFLGSFVYGVTLTARWSCKSGQIVQEQPRLVNR